MSNSRACGPVFVQRIRYKNLLSRLFAALLLSSCAPPAAAPSTGTSQPTSSDILQPTEGKTAPTEWELVYHFAPDPLHPLLNDDLRAYAWVEWKHNGDARYAETNDYADSSFSYKNFSITQAESEGMRLEVINLVGRLTYQPAVNGILAPGKPGLSGKVDGESVQMVVPANLDRQIRAALAALLARAAAMDWSYDSGLNLPSAPLAPYR